MARRRTSVEIFGKCRYLKQVVQLSHLQNISGILFCTKRCRCRKTQASHHSTCRISYRPITWVLFWAKAH